MNKYLCFIDAADDAAMYPVERLQSITCAGDATVLVKFAPGSLGEGQAASVDVVTLTVTADTEKAVMQGIVEKINAHPNMDPFVVICDDVNSIFAHANILSCTIALDA
mgnify:FL=1|tara:strand:- start:183 stop:506 length:324 start_codon:yes stop_codon:yes gene_type:complete